MELDWTNDDVILQHEVPLSDKKDLSSTLTLTQPVTDCSEHNPVVLLVVNPIKGCLTFPYYFKVIFLN